jgi:hypothetical protein
MVTPPSVKQHLAAIRMLFQPSSYVATFAREEPAKCPNCRREILEKTLVEPV